jgi:hypothetical protein
MLSILGIPTTRVWFPTSDGINSFGITAGILLVASAIGTGNFKFNTMNNNLLYGVGAVIGLTIILLTDSRGALLAAFVSIIAGLMLPRKYYRVLFLLPLVSIVLPKIITIIAQMVPQDILTQVSRSPRDITSLNGRTIIWNETLNVIFSSDILSTLFGFGYRGQINSGLTERFVTIFGYSFGSVATVHNSFYQLAIDTGLLGVFIYLLITSFLLQKLVYFLKVDNRNTGLKMMLFTLVYILTIGATESVLTIDYQEVVIFFCFIYISIATYVPRKAGWYKEKPITVR